MPLPGPEGLRRPIRRSLIIVARLYLEQGKTVEARKLLDEILNSPLDLPISSRNKFLGLRLKLAETLEDFIKFSLRKPFAFDFDGTTGTIDEFIAEQKSWYDRANEDKTREEYDREIDERWTHEKLWQDREMFDSATIDAINNHFPLSVLMQLESSPALPDYMRDRFALPIFARALLLGDVVTLRKIAPQIVKDHPEFETQINGHFECEDARRRPERIAFYGPEKSDPEPLCGGRPR